MNQIVSVSPVASAGLPGPSYKWVRINPATEQSLNVDVNGDGAIDSVAVLFYDPANANSAYKSTPGLVLSSPPVPATPPTPTAVEALEITALAVLPNGSQKILQYVVAPLIISAQVSSNSVSPFGTNFPNFPAALTLAGNGVSYTGPQTTTFTINGQDQCNTNNYYYSIGYTNNGDGTGITTAASGSPPGYANDYQGYPSLTGPPPGPTKGLTTIKNVNPPNPANAPIAPSWLTPASLDSIAQDITKSADVVIDGVSSGPAHASNLPAMAPATPMTVVVSGDWDLTGWHGVGYGLLLVTGTLTYDPDATWEGLVLVIGQGVFVSTMGGGLNGFDGAVFVAKTRDASGNLLSSLGATSFSQTGSSGNFGRGINYNSCWISGNPGNPIVQGIRGPLINGPLSYKVLSFREIGLP